MTTSNDPEAIRAQIAATRAGLSNDVNELGDKVSPGQIAKRQRDRVTGAVMGVKDHIMGSAGDAKSSAGDALSTVGDAVTGTPGKVAQQTQGSPLAAGLIAFGAGVLLSALIPASQPEARAAAAIKEQAQPLVDPGHRWRERSGRESAGTGPAGPGIGEVHRDGRGGDRQTGGHHRCGRRQGPSPGCQGRRAAARLQQLNL